MITIRDNDFVVRLRFLIIWSALLPTILGCIWQARCGKTPGVQSGPGIRSASSSPLSSLGCRCLPKPGGSWRWSPPCSPPRTAGSWCCSPYHGGPRTVSRTVLFYKIYIFLPKIVKNDQPSSQQCSEENTASNIWSPPSPRWSTQRANDKYKDHL